MSVHPRKIIRDRAVDILNEKTDAGKNVVANQIIPEWIEDLPAVLVYTRSESIEEYAAAPRELKRDLSLTLEIIAEGTNEVATSDKLDAIALQIEEIFHKDDTLGCAGISKSILSSVDFDFDGSGNSSVGSCRLTYDVTYYQVQPDVDVDIAKVVNADWQVGHDDSSPDTIIEAKDKIDLPQS